MAEELGTAQPARQPSALDIAAQWAQLPAEHLAVALSALEPQLAREHEARMQAERTRQYAELEQLRSHEAELKRAHRRRLIGTYSAVLVALATLGASVYFGTHQQPWLAVTFFGPTLLSLVKILALGKSDADDVKQAAAAARAAANALPPPP
ncbi:hypothetical protein [Streptomyces acidiscabies]|uniref:hypothetical protein n=1 Tax=Streptomyces acidiscabies TaxID=42234 RepID=UPI00073F3742|nr:hypothetical protein [Streptomyces acidiscabies]GAQ50703.1 hypothetical protein a10_00480 [Streptomyces acidiscabies]